MADCSHALCLPYDSCRFPVRTQDERDTDLPRFHRGGVVRGPGAKGDDRVPFVPGGCVFPLADDECVLVIREGVGVMCVRDHVRHDPGVVKFAMNTSRGYIPPADGRDPDIWVTTESVKARPPRRRWWHRLTRRNP